MKYANGYGPSREIHAGSGYLSQDSAVAVLGMQSQPTHVSVHWPGGKSTEIPIAAGTKEVVVDFAK